jgi:hypothetical protein
MLPGSELEPFAVAPLAVRDADLSKAIPTSCPALAIVLLFIGVSIEGPAFAPVHI